MYFFRIRITYLRIENQGLISNQCIISNGLIALKNAILSLNVLIVN